MWWLKEKCAVTIILSIFIVIFPAIGQGGADTSPNFMKGISPNVVADYLHTVIEADREVYTSRIVERLQNQGIILATEDWEARRALPLPDQFLMESAHLVAEKKEGIRYRLISLWPLYPRNAPATRFEKQGLQAVMKNPNKPYTGMITSGKKQFFQAIYADRAVSEACLVCHNTHPMSLKRDFHLKDVMGGLVITIPLS
jgi:hypothetical protein